jgi:chorismate-pyruvate lyase
MHAFDSERWIPAQALHLSESDAVLHSWLTTPGLLTERVRDAVGAPFRLRVLAEGTSGSDFVRRIELGRDGQPWIYAETMVPRPTLARHPWLAAIGTRSLGEVLAGAAGALRRSDFEFACLDADAPIVARALALVECAPRALWVRRSTLRVDDAPFVVHEVFMPVVAERGA